MKRSHRIACMLASLTMLSGSATGRSEDLLQSFSRPLAIERSASTATIPLKIRMGKLFLTASVNGSEREFVFDTGSPTILTREFANSLELEVIGQNTGRDANGRIVTMDVAIVETLSLGEIAFHKVPVLIFDYSALDLGHCLFDGGVIGSEILPGSVWRIDTENGRLDAAASRDSFPEASRTAQLHDFGYPHAPIVTYSVGDVRDNAIFDTGNAEELALFHEVAGLESVQRHILPGSKVTGHGSDGVSAGGRGQDRELLRFTLSSLLVGDQNIGPIQATTREPPPSLIGAGILDRFVVTLDYISGEFLIQGRRQPAVERHRAGYAISIVEGFATVTQLFDSTPAARAGLQLGDRISSINGRQMTGYDNSSECESAAWLSDAFNGSAAVELEVVRNGQRRMIRIPPKT